MLQTVDDWTDAQVTEAAQELGAIHPHLSKTVLRLMVRAAMVGLEPAEGVDGILRECSKLSWHLRKSGDGS